MGQSNEQAVVSAGAKIESLKQEYMNALRSLVLAASSKGPPTLEQLLNCQARANSFFNYAENFVGNSGLLGAHTNGLWVTGFAETCYAVLDAFVEHMLFLRSYKAKLGGDAIEPAPHAYANMQRMVVEYLLPSQASELRAKFIDHRLPTTGFDMPAAEDAKNNYIGQVILSTVIGVVGVAGSITLAIKIPSPTPWQEFVFRGAFSVGLAALAAIVPGFISVKARARGFGNYLKVVAGGAIAVFVVTFFFNPPKVQHDSARAKPEESAKP